MNGKTPSYRLHRASGQAVVTLQVDGKSKDFYLGQHNSKESHAKYDQLIADWLKSGRSGSGDTREVGSLCRRFLEHARSYYRKNGQPTSSLVRFRFVARAIQGRFDGLRISRFGPEEYKALRSVWIEAGLSRSTINLYARTIREIFRWGVESNLVPVEVYQRLQAIRSIPFARGGKENPPVGPVPWDRLATTLQHCKPRLASLIRLQLMTGMRSGELLGMRPCDVDRSVSPWIYRPKFHKTSHLGSARVVPLGEAAQAILTPEFERIKDSEVIFRSKHEQRVEPLTPQVIRTRVSCYYWSVRGACLRAWPCPGTRATQLKGLKPELRATWLEHAAKVAWHPHQLRHNAATLLRDATGIEAARLQLGHTKADMTRRYASDRTNPDLISASQTLDRLANAIITRDTLRDLLPPGTQATPPSRP